MFNALVLAAILLVGATSAQQSFYVSPDGSDANDGTSPASPWLTLAHAGPRITVGNSTRTLYLQRNGTWLNDPLTVAPRTAGDVLLGRVIIDAYGNATLPQPLVMHGGTLAARVTCVTLGNIGADGVVVRNLHLSGCAQGIILAVKKNGHPANNVIVERNTFMDMRTPPLSYNPSFPEIARAILPSGAFTNMSVLNNVGVRINTFIRMGTVQGLRLDGNTLQQCDGTPCVMIVNDVKDLVMSNNVFLRNVPERDFMFGSTDVLMGALSGSNSMINNDFNARGEYEGAPDGCNVDFETGTVDFTISGNTFYKTWGSGVMVFGRDKITSHNLTISNNVFFRVGCTQASGDSGGIALMCPEGAKPSGNVAGNTFYSCQAPNAAPAIAPAFPGCESNMNVANNTIDGASAMVAMPQITIEISPTNTKKALFYFHVGAKTATANATLRYTLDGSRPTEQSSVLEPVEGLMMRFPGPVVAINVRGFKSGMVPSVTDGLVFERNYVLARIPHTHGPGGMAVPLLRGKLEGLALMGNATSVRGWVVDPLLPKIGWGPVAVTVTVDGALVASSIADQARPDLVKTGAAPNADHGFSFNLPPGAAATLLSAGRHVLRVFAVGSPNAAAPTPLPLGSDVVVCSGKVCS